MVTRPEMNDVREQVRLSARPANSGTRLSALRKKLTRRARPDHSQVLRRTIQLAFLFLNVWLGVAFYFWVRRMETGAPGRIVVRPAGVEGWLPIAGLMNLKYWLTTGRVPASHPAALFLLVSFLAIAFLFRKAFCSWLCPVGTFSEYLWRAGRQIFGRSFQVPRWLDLPMRSLKYLLLGFFAWAIANMTPDAIERFMHSPYGAVADVRMLNFFRDLGQTAAIVLGVLVIASVLVQNFWCRYLCPYGALLGLTSLLSPFRIRRSEAQNPPVSIARNAPRLAPPPCPWTNWSPLSRPSVRDVRSALPCARPKAPCNSRWGHGRVLPITVDFRHGSWPLELQSYSSESSDMQRPPVIGTVTCPTTFIAN
jgi:4Fe-4S binding domain